jgi:hypothetical protein
MIGCNNIPMVYYYILLNDDMTDICGHKIKVGLNQTFSPIKYVFNDIKNIFHNIPYNFYYIAIIDSSNLSTISNNGFYSSDIINVLKIHDINDLDFVDNLIKSGAYIHPNLSETFARNNNLDAICRLMYYNWKLSLDDEYTLYWFIKHGNISAVKFIIDTFPFVSLSDIFKLVNYANPFINAVIYNQLDILQYLMCKVPITISLLNYLFKIASDRNNDEIKRYLLNNGAHVKNSQEIYSLLDGIKVTLYNIGDELSDTDNKTIDIKNEMLSLITDMHRIIKTRYDLHIYDRFEIFYHLGVIKTKIQYFVHRIPSSIYKLREMAGKISDNGKFMVLLNKLEICGSCVDDHHRASYEMHRLFYLTDRIYDELNHFRINGVHRRTRKLSIWLNIIWHRITVEHQIILTSHIRNILTITAPHRVIL